MARQTNATAHDNDDDDDDERAFRTIVQQQQQLVEDKDATKKKKILRPRLKPISYSDDDEDNDADIDNPSLSISCARDLGFGSFVATYPSSSSSSSSSYSLEKGDDTDETNQNNNITANNHTDARDSSFPRPPPSPKNNEIDTMHYSEFVKKNSTTTTSNTKNSSTSADIIPERQQQLRRQSNPTLKLQPKSTVFSSPDECGGGGGTSSSFPPSPHTPNYYDDDDDDGYGVFGFGLISAAKDENKIWTTSTTTTTTTPYTVNESLASELDLGEEKENNEEDVECNVTSDATFDGNNNSPSSSPRNASRVQGIGERGQRQRRRHQPQVEGGRRRKHTSRISSLSLSRVLSADSYISDDSTTSSDHHQQQQQLQPPQEQGHHHHQPHQRENRNNGSDPTTNDAYFNRHDLLRNGSSVSSSNTNNFSVFSRKNSLHTQASSRSLTLHLMSSDRGDDDGTCNEDSINSLESSLAAPSDVDPSSFYQSRALNQQQQHQQLQLDHQIHQFYNANDATTQHISHGRFVPLTSTSSRELITQTHPSPPPNNDAFELILSISEESGERKLLHPTPIGRTHNNIACSEEGFGRMMYENIVGAQQKQSRVESLTPSSIDDQLISNDIRSYFRRISSPGTDPSVSPSSPPPLLSSSHSSGRHPPIRNQHVESIISHYHNASDVGLGGPTAAHPRDSPFLTNLQMINSQASYGSVIHNLHGGNCTSEEEEVEEFGTSGKSSLSACTPQRKATTSLAYSDEEGLARQNRRLMKSNLVEWKEDKSLEEVDEARTTNRKVYSSRWIMLMYMTMLHLLSGWTCFSVAPFSELALDSLGSDPDYLVATFFAANFIASAFEPMILRRLGLRRAVLLGALLLMTGNMLKDNTLGSYKMDNFVGRRAYLSFILAGLSGPLYQNTASILITSWFPQKERRTAANVVLCGNQLGMFCSFIFGKCLVRTSNDVLPYFHLLSVISMVVFVGAAMQFSDCPQTPPSGMTRVIRGTNERPIFAVVKLAPPSTSDDEPNGFVNTTKGECDILLPTDSQTLRNSRQLSYGSTDPSIARPSLPADHQVERSIATRRNFDVEEFPREAMPAYHELEFFLCDFSLTFQPKDYLPPTLDDGAEPIITQTSILKIDVCDNQLWRALRACCSHKRFLSCISSYAVSKIAINSLSTFMYYFSLDVGIVGSTFQLTVMASSFLCRKMMGETRLHYMIIGFVALSSLSLALCGANLDSKVILTSNLLTVALFVGPLQPLSTNLGVEFVSPLSENTVVVNQLLFSNLLSAICILIFKALKNASATGPEFAYSFRFLALFCPTIHLSAICIASFWPKRITNHTKELTKKRSEQQIKSPSQEVDNPILRPPSRDLPWKEKFPFLLPRAV